MADVLFCSDTFWTANAGTLKSIVPELDVVRQVGAERVSDADRARITVAFWSPDVVESRDRTRAFLGACLRMPNLRWLQVCFAGTDDPVFTRLRERRVIVTNAAGTNAAPIAQMVFGYILAFSCDLPRLAIAQRDRSWQSGRVLDLEGVRLGIVGMGAIGSEVARIGVTLRMEVIGLRRTVTGNEPCVTWTDNHLARLLTWCDVLVIAAPLTDNTRGLIGAEQLASMREGAWLVNVGRGAIVDEQALVDALRSGHIGAAGLDVFETEPLAKDSPLWDMSNVIVTPHMAGTSLRSGRRTVTLFFENLSKFVSGEPLMNVALDQQPA
jgi:phosphoglycerate dehydrogenase-like enzyme